MSSKLLILRQAIGYDTHLSNLICVPQCLCCFTAAWQVRKSIAQPGRKQRRTVTNRLSKSPCCTHACLERKGKFTLFSDHDGSLLRQQPGAPCRLVLEAHCQKASWGSSMLQLTTVAAQSCTRAWSCAILQEGDGRESPYGGGGR